MISSGCAPIDWREGARVAGEFGVQRVRQMQLGDRLLDASRRLLERHVLAEPEGDGDRRETGPGG